MFVSRQTTHVLMHTYMGTHANFSAFSLTVFKNLMKFILKSFMRPRKYFISDSPPPRFLLKCKQRNKKGGKGEGDDRKKKEETGRPANRMSLLPLLVFHPGPVQLSWRDSGEVLLGGG